VTFNHLTLRSLSGTAGKLPMKRPLGRSAQTIDTASLLLVDLLTAEGITGRAYAFCYLPSIARSLVPIVAELSGALAGQPLMPLDLTSQITRHFKLPGIVGPLEMVASSVDTAMWDALAMADMPLARFLGASPRQLPAYNSNGLGLMSPEAVADEAEALLENGFRAVKLRLGRGEIGVDLAVVRTVRKRLPDQVRLMVDFNQCPDLLRRDAVLPRAR
jgi:mandelate racemase